MANGVIFPFFLFLSVVVVSIFSFTTVSFWSSARRGEREAFYKNETVRRLLELQSPTAAEVLEAIREENGYQDRRRKERSRLAGLTTAAAGSGLLLFLYVVTRNVTAQPVYSVALIPILVGVAFVLHSYLMSSK